MLDFDEPWDNAHDPQRAVPVGYCRKCSGEIYYDEELYEYDGLCARCWMRMERDKNAESSF